MGALYNGSQGIINSGFLIVNGTPLELFRINKTLIVMSAEASIYFLEQWILTFTGMTCLDELLRNISIK